MIIDGARRHLCFFTRQKVCRSSNLQIDRICNFAKQVFETFGFLSIGDSIVWARRAWRGRALPRRTRLSRHRLNPCGRRSLARFSTNWAYSGNRASALHEGRTVLAAVKATPPRRGGQAAGLDLRCAPCTSTVQGRDGRTVSGRTKKLTGGKFRNASSDIDDLTLTWWRVDGGDRCVRRKLPPTRTC